MSIMAIKEVVQKVSDVVSKKHLTFNADSQSLEVNKDFMADVIPVLKEEGIDVDQKQLDTSVKALRTVIAGTALATGELAVNTMAKKAHKDINVLSATFPLANGAKVEHSVSRTFETRAPGKEEPIVKHGRLETTLEIQGSKTKSGDLKAIRDALYEKAEEALK